jgi:HEAT repeat protein
MVLRALDDPSLQDTALKSLKTARKVVFPPIEKMISSPMTPTLRRKQLILFLGSLDSGEGKQILMRMLSIENQKLKKTIVQNILDSGIVWTHADKKNLLKHNLKKDVERISWLLHLREVFSTAPTHEAAESFDFFLRAVQEDITDTRELILYQLLLLENNEIFTRAVRILLSDSYELYLPAIGMVQDLVSGRLYQKLKPVMLLPLAQKRKEPLVGLNVENAVKELSGVLINPPYALNHWIRTTALYALRRLGSPSGIPIAEASLSDTNPIVLEAAIWTLMRLQSDKEKLHQKLLSIPTTRLSELSLDKLLDS